MLRSDIEDVVAYMYERYGEPISLADMASVARLSPFHFSRTFLASTGVTPGRFLSAVRLHRAKTLLLTTSETVTDISYMVGYNSVGTFTTRFTRSVGLPPVQFRRTSGFISRIPGIDKAASTACPEQPAGSTDDGGRAEWSAHPAAGAVMGRVLVPKGLRLSRVYLGLFDNAIAQGPMVAGAALEDSLTFALPSVPEGEWYALAVGALAVDPNQGADAAATWLVAREGPVKVLDGEQISLRLKMRGGRRTDPPILLALPNLETRTRRELVGVAA